ncbi:C-C motif chemokine 2 [Amia ocellicauda]|uniref:C-C motif chemokine 2 n=1 Tax=Amia ocellicauda TaxID=2972642 RepID=UPI0034646F9B
MRSIRILFLCLRTLILVAIASGASGPAKTCCPKWSTTVLQFEKVKDYVKQNKPVCPIEAVVFTTVREIQVCADPSKPWVKKAIKHVDELKKKSFITVKPLHLSATKSPPEITQENLPEDGTSEPEASCCLDVTCTVLPLNEIKDFYRQKKDGKCPVEAVIFTTVKGLRVCAKPRRRWVKKAVQYLKSLNKKKNEEHH